MARFEINLIRHQIIPPGRRRILFWCVLSHLLLCAAAMSVVSYHGLHAIVAATAAKAEEARLEVEFAKLHPGGKGISACEQEAGTQLRQVTDRIAGINRVLEQRTNLARLIVPLLMPLPREVMLNHLELDRAKGEVLFDLLVTAGNGEDGVFASHVMQTWRETPALASSIGRIKAISTQRRSVDGQQLLMLKYSYRLNGSREP